MKEYVNSSEFSASPRYGRYEECPDAVVCLHTCAKQQRVALPANMHRASSEPLALCQHAVVPELISPGGIITLAGQRVLLRQQRCFGDLDGNHCSPIAVTGGFLSHSPWWRGELPL